MRQREAERTNIKLGCREVNLEKSGKSFVRRKKMKKTDGIKCFKYRIVKHVNFLIT